MHRRREHVEEPSGTLSKVLDVSKMRIRRVLPELPTALVVLVDEIVEVTDAVRDGNDDFLVGLVDPADAENARSVLLLLVENLLGELDGGVNLIGDRPNRLRALVLRNILEELCLVVENHSRSREDVEDCLADVSHLIVLV